MHSIANLSPLRISEIRSFSKKHIVFFEKSYFQSHSTANLLKFGDEKFSRSEPANIGHFHIGHKQLASNCKKMYVLSG